MPPADKLSVPDEVAALVRGLHPLLKKKIKAALKIILKEPDSGKALKDELTGLRSFRVSRFRIIYKIQNNIIELVAVGPRERIYEETLQIFKKSLTSEN